MQVRCWCLSCARASPVLEAVVRALQMAPKKRTKQGCALAAVPEEFADDLALAFPALSLSEPRSK